ncbi:hypothetical protein ABT324_28255 [Saccharopolyspora sp. NPDC000359]|uniref:hypothetical protein n=1 Tax=Saccharopolyspora sp. NPDC000359 TaxID=3154251 RepID=UPI00332651CF
MINNEQPEALHAALADLRRALAGRPAKAAPRTRPGRARGMVIDPTAAEGEVVLRSRNPRQQGR